MIRLSIRVARESAETVLAEILELAPGGVEEVDAGESVEYAIYGAEGELPALPELRAAAGGVEFEVATSVVPDDWEDRWKRFHRPVEIGGHGAGLRVSPPWDSDGSHAELVIDPGRAFGTGAHPTTRLCLELLLEIEPSGSCVDVGCGSGVLAIAAARLGWAPVVALDFDPASVEATTSNADVNGVSVTSRRFDLRRDGPLPAGELLLANLLRPLLLDLCEAGFDGPVPANLVASGLLAGEADEVAGALAAAFGMVEGKRLVDNGWAALRMNRAR